MSQLWEIDSVVLLAQKRNNQKCQYPDDVKQAQNRVRKRIESTIAQLEDQLHLSRVRARNHWGLLTRLIDKFSAFSLAALLNHALGRPLSALKGLAFA